MLHQRPWLSVLLGAALSCAGSPDRGAALPSGAGDPGTIRYRLLLHDNPIDPAAALQCYANCRQRTTPEDYLGCLEACPGFETTVGGVCGAEETPPVAVCFVAQRVVPTSEPQRGSMVIARLGGFVVSVALTSVCALSHSQCQGSTPESP